MNQSGLEEFTATVLLAPRVHTQTNAGSGVRTNTTVAICRSSSDFLKIEFSFLPFANVFSDLLNNGYWSPAFQLIASSISSAN